MDARLQTSTAYTGAAESVPEAAQAHRRQVQQFSLRALVPAAAVSASRKLDPRTMVHNPVMFVTEVGSAVSAYYLIAAIVTRSAEAGFLAGITAWLWFTV